MSTVGPVPLPSAPDGDGVKFLKVKEKEEVEIAIPQKPLEKEEVVITQPPTKTKTIVDEQPKVSTLEPERTLPKPSSGLDLLVSAESLQVTRKLNLIDATFLRGKKNNFYVRNPDQNLIYEVAEDNKWWVGYCCYGLRPMHLKVFDSEGTEVVRIQRPYAFTTRVLPCQLQAIRVYSPPDRCIGSAVQIWTPVTPKYTVKNAAGVDVFEVKGPRITVSCFQDVRFQITRPNGTLVASTNKRWEGIWHALVLAPYTDTFSITYHEKAMTGDERALLLATALLLDYMYYDV